MSTQASVQTKKRIQIPALTTERLLGLIVFIAIFTMAVRIPITPDTWWHLRTGEYILENRTIPTADPFSHTQAGGYWIDHGWLAQIFWYAVYALDSSAALPLAVAGLVTLAFWCMWKQIEGNLFVAAFSMILGAIVSSVAWVARPQMISFVLAAVVAYVLDRFKRRDGRLLPWLPLIMLLWVNIHGGFAIGFMLMLAYLAGEVVNNLTAHEDDPVAKWSRLNHLLIAIGLSLAVVAINPYTWRMWLYPFQTVGIGALRDFIAEWQSPDFHLPHVQPFLLMLLLVLAALARTRRRADWTDLALVALWTAWSLFAGRNIALFGLIVTPILARYADLAWTEQWQTWGYQKVPFSRFDANHHETKDKISQAGKTAASNFKSILNWGLLGLILIAALIKISLPLSAEANLKIEQASLPYEAVEFLKNSDLPGPMFNSYNWGGYLIFKLWPEYPVYIDGRTDLYDDAFLRRYIKVIVADEGWRTVLEEDGINLVFIESGSTLAKFLADEPDWREAYWDGQAVIFTREMAAQN